MKKLSLICVTTLLGMSLAGCGNSSGHKATSSSRTSSSKVVKHHKNTSSKKQSKSSSNADSQQAARQSTTQQSNTNQQVRGNVPASNNDSDDGQDQRPDDVPANFKEYVSYTTDGHRMTQWNDAGQYEGDPDVQYQTIKAQTDAGF